LISITIVTLFPEHVFSFFNKGILKRAFEKRLFDFNVIDLRSFAVGKHCKVDDYPYSHHKGMLLRCDVLYNAITSIDHVEDYRLLYTSPSGKVFNQNDSKQYLDHQKLIICSGFYEGVDARLMDVLPVEEVSIGDFVLMSGDLPALVISETILRQVPGVLGNQSCIEDDSIFNGTLEHPQYTKPETWKGIEVPSILKSGHHKEIERWKRTESLKKTLFNRPDLLSTLEISETDRDSITTIIEETFRRGDERDDSKVS